MFINQREVPAEFLFYQALAARRNLSPDEQFQFSNIQKGFEGECLYDQIFDEVGHQNVYIFRDLYLKIGGSVTQYDSIVISDENVTINEIKNFQGDLHYEKENWYKNGYLLEDDAFSQLRRAKGKLIKLSKNSDVKFDVEGSLIFINDDFRLTAEDQTVFEKTVTRSYVRNYMKKLNSRNRGNRAKKIANIINKHKVSNEFFDKNPDISMLKLGLYCGECKSYDLEKNKFHFTCNLCGTRETYETHVLRAINDYKFLFYNQPITKNAILKLINYEIKKSAVGRILKKYCNLESQGRSSVHIFKYYDLKAAKASAGEPRYKDKLVKYVSSK